MVHLPHVEDISSMESAHAPFIYGVMLRREMAQSRALLLPLNQKEVIMARKSMNRKSNKAKARAKARTPVKGKTRAARMKFQAGQKITVLPAGRKPADVRREGSPPFKRYTALIKSRTVGAFLAKPGMGKWSSTIARAVRENLISVR